MNLRDVTSIADKKGVPRGIIEKDAVLTLALNELSKKPIASKMAFKGGTAIKKIHFREARFSEDLDFSVSSASQEEVLEQLSQMVGFNENGFTFAELRKEQTSAGLRLALKYLGPLSHATFLRFDFSFRQNTSLEPLTLNVFDDYFLLPVFSMHVMQLEEILAEKIQAVTNRLAARDVYDIWFLLNKSVELDMKIVKEKFAFYNEEFSLEELEKKLPAFEPRWKEDLRQFVKNVPDFKEVSKEIIRELKDQLK